MSLTDQLTLIAAQGRSDFSGRTDKYMVGSKNPTDIGDLSDAMIGVAPFDIAGTMFDQDFRDRAIQRLNRYRRHWDFYDGKHWINPWYDGERKSVFNFCKTITDKSVQWFVAQGWEVKAPAGNESVADLLNAVWKRNKRISLTTQAAQYGAVTGDAFFYVTVTDRDFRNRELPRKEWKARIQALNPSNVFPVWSPVEPGVMIGCLIQQVAYHGQQKIVMSIYIDPEEFEVWENGKSQGRFPNKLGEIPVVHVPNFVLSYSAFGMSDIESIIELNEEYNSVANSIRRSINYHSEPTTLIYGAKASRLEKGANKVWSGLPIDARVENLVLGDDLKATYQYLEMLEGLIMKTGEVPKLAYDSHEVAVSNTSGLTMQMMFQPLIEKTKKRRPQYDEGFQAVNRLVLKIERDIIGTNIGVLADNEEELMTTTTQFSSPLPKDEQVELDQGIKKIQEGIWSQNEGIRRLAKVVDEDQLKLEIMADQRMKVAMEAEKQKALELVTPNLTFPFLGSIALTQEFEDIAAKSLKEEEKAVKSME